MSQENQAPELLKKITIRDIDTSEQLKRVVANGVSLDLAHVMGTARGIKHGVSSFGDWCALTGDFLAINAESQKEYRSTILILPAIAQDLVVQALKESDSDAVDLAFTITASPDSVDGKVRGKGYKFGARPVIQPKETDALSRLKGLFPGVRSTTAPALAQAPTEKHAAAPLVSDADAANEEITDADLDAMAEHHSHSAAVLDPEPEPEPELIATGTRKPEATGKRKR